jgi:hypothetical protein
MHAALEHVNANAGTSLIIPSSFNMCYYDTITYACGDWKWGNCRQQCDREYRMGETCGMRLVYENTPEEKHCKICMKLATKRGRMDKECRRYQTWQTEGRLKSLSATVEKTLREIHELDAEIKSLEAERVERYRDNMRARNPRA